MGGGSKTTAELEREVDNLRQLLQVGAALAGAVLAGQDVRAELREWLDAIARESSGS